MGSDFRRTQATTEILSSRRWRVALVALTLAVASLYLVGVPHNPPGFHIDESSIAYNAHTIAQTGTDEHGIAWPLYFRAFGDYKNPTYIYLLAALFRLTGPEILIARLLSAIAGILAAVTLGVLAVRLTRKPTIGWFTTLTAFLTPWLFEISRIVLESSLYPLSFALFLLCLENVRTKERWSRLEVAALAITLALLTYTYSIGRLFGPLLALGLVLFATLTRWRSVLRTWFAYAVTLIPLIIYNDTHPGALIDRFRVVTYIEKAAGPGEIAAEFFTRYLANWNPWRLLVSGDPNKHQVAHLFGSEHFLGAAFVLSVLGLWTIGRERRCDTWWRFVVYALVIAPVPASLTMDDSHMLRLIPVPVMLLVVAIAGMETLSTHRHRWLLALIGLIVTQGLAFQWKFHIGPTSAWRMHLFDAQYRSRIFDRAMAIGARPIYIADEHASPGYIQAYWYGTLAGLDLSNVAVLGPHEPPPAGGLVITTKECTRCDILERVEPYTLYRAHGPTDPSVSAPGE